MGKPVPYEGMDPLVKQEHLQCVAGSGIAFLYGLNVKPNVFDIIVYSTLSLTS